MTCIQAKYTREINAYGQDECGRTITATAAAVTGIKLTEIEITRLIEEGDRQDLNSTDGEICYNDDPCSTDRGFDVRMQLCGKNLAFSVLTGDASAIIAGGAITGLNFDGFDCTKGFSLEVIFRASGDDCDTAGDPQCFFMFFPRLTATRATGSSTVGNGNGIMQDEYTLTAYKNPKVFIDPVTGLWDIPTNLAYLSAYDTQLQAGTFAVYDLIDCPDLRGSSDCEFVLV